MDNNTNTNGVLQATTITIQNELIAYLDEVSASIRRQSGAAISRSALIRAFVRGMQQSGFDLSRCGKEADIAGVLSWLLSMRSGSTQAAQPVTASTATQKRPAPR